MGKNKLYISFSAILFLILTCVTVERGFGQSRSQASANAINGSPERVVTELYAALSFTAGKSFERSRVQTLFIPKARVENVGPLANSSAGERFTSIEGFLDVLNSSVNQPASREEKELWQRVERFGHVAHVFSAYELTFTTSTGKIVKRRGINSIQLSFDDSGWHIVSLIWDTERPDNPLPEQK